MAQTQGVAGSAIYLQFDLAANGQCVVTGQWMDHHETPPLSAPFDRNGSIDKQLAIRADGPHTARANGGFAPFPASIAHIPRLIGPEVALGMKGGEVGDQQRSVATLAADHAGLLLMMAQHEAGSGMFHGKAPATINEKRKRQHTPKCERAH